MTITKERLHEIIVNNSATHAEFMAITSMLLGCMEQEPVAWVSKTDVDTGEFYILARRYYSKACPMPVYVSPVLPKQPDATLTNEGTIKIDGWIKCDEHMPKKSGAYWCWFGNEKPSVIQQRVCMFNTRHNEWCDSSVTHWMPLPIAPTPEGEPSRDKS
ncbi:DUF551 domain-containing protein [Yersinia enterocolitica]